MENFKPHPQTVSLEILVSRGGNASTGDRVRIPSNPKLPSHFGLLLPRDQQERRGVTFLAWVMGPGHQETVKLLIHNGGRKEYVWHPSGSLG